MPGSLSQASPTGVLPQNLSLAFTQSGIYPMLSTIYHDGTTERRFIEDGVNNPRLIKSWKLTRRLTATQAATLKTFFEDHKGGAVPFYFYNPFEGTPVGSNYDSSGDGMTGRYICKFSNQTYSESTGLAFTDVPLEFTECA